MRTLIHAITLVVQFNIEILRGHIQTTAHPKVPQEVKANGNSPAPGRVFFQFEKYADTLQF